MLVVYHPFCSYVPYVAWQLEAEENSPNRLIRLTWGPCTTKVCHKGYIFWTYH